MSDIFRFDEPYFPVPPEAVDADPATTIKDLLYRVAKLEQTLEEERARAVADTGELLLEIIALSDDVSNIVERWGIASNAQEIAMVRSVVALGRKLLAILKHHQVQAISTIGAPLDPETSDVAASELREGVAPGMVLRETQIGYTWPYGLLRRAQVVINSSAAQSPGQSSEQDISSTSL